MRVYLAAFCATITVGISPLQADLNKKAAELLQSEPYNQTEAAALLLDASLTPENFIEIVKKSGGAGRVMDTLSLMASSPSVVGKRFDELLESIQIYPHSEAAEYLAKNQYLTDDQVRKLGKAASADSTSRLALAFVNGGAAGTEDLDRLVDLITKGKTGAVAEAVAGARGLSAEAQKKLLFIATQTPTSPVSGAFAKNPSLNAETMDALGANAVRNPVGALAENFASNPGISAAQMIALAQVASELPDGGIAAGLGRNKGLHSEVFSELEQAAVNYPYSRLSVALASNPNLPDSLFNALAKALKGDETGEMSTALAGAGGAASTQVRAAILANLAISDPELRICGTLIENPAVPPAHMAALYSEAAAKPGSRLSRAFIEQVREKRFRGNRHEKMKILEAALMSGGVDSISPR